MSIINSIIKLVTGDIVIDLGASQIGTAFNSSLFNVSSSALGTGFTGINCAKSTAKAIITPSPWCKVLYGVSAGLSGISCVSSGLCLLSSYSCIAPVPVFFGTVGWVTSVSGGICGRVGDFINPTASVTSTAVDTCVDTTLDFLTKGK